MAKTSTPLILLLLASLTGCMKYPFTIIPSSPTYSSISTTQSFSSGPVATTVDVISSPAQLTENPDLVLPDCLMNLPYKETAVVRHVTDGDTIVVEINGEDYKLRYIGIDTPEVHPEVEYYGPQATEKNKELVVGKTLTLFRDQSESDDYGRLLRYVVADGVFVNLVLVREGFADAKDYRPDTACSQVLREAENSAWKEKLGMWSKSSK